MFPVSAVSLLDSGVPSPICLTVNETSRHSEQHPLFSGRSRRADYLQLYPELDQLCERFGFDWGDALADWSWLVRIQSEGFDAVRTAMREEIDHARRP